MEWAHVLIGFVSALAGCGAGAWLLKLFQQGHDNRARDGADANLRLGQLADRLEKELSAVRREQERALVGERTCREELAGMRSDGRWIYDRLTQLYAACHRGNVAVDDLPPLPERFLEARSVGQVEEFTANSSAHAAGLLRAEAEASRRPGAGGPERAGP